VASTVSPSRGWWFLIVGGRESTSIWLRVRLVRTHWPFASSVAAIGTPPLILSRRRSV